ncbi:MAG: tetratricopeptide repeat protein, partial [Flammeovirgaceae bacterium]|nr:tetratricopeptide repeat protein [Flammeovirgaceae bacterium]MDW8287808.1 tetratricopeptide repeat protein [Flammeovirgaceae bacterium]
MRIIRKILWIAFFFLLYYRSVAQFENSNKKVSSPELELANEYYSKGDYAKAIELYKKLLKDDTYLPEIHKPYLDALIKTQNQKEAIKYTKRLVKNYPTHPIYNIDYGKLLIQPQDSTEAFAHLDKYIQLISRDQSTLRYAAFHFLEAKLFRFAEKCYFTARQLTGEKYYLELAELYYLWGRKMLTVEQYMQLLEEEEGQLDLIQNLLQDKFQDEEELATLEKGIAKYIQKNPDNLAFNEMFMWYWLQRKQYSKALIQAKAIDKRQRQEGFKVLEIGKLALSGKCYEDAINAFQYLVDKYKGKIIYSTARELLLQAKEELIKNTFPLNFEKISSLANDYRQLLYELGIKPSTANAVINLARLQAFYLNQKDSAIWYLSKLIANPTLPRQISSTAKIELGDIYLLKGEPWESTLLYSQVEKAEKDSNLGHIAKLRNAKLSYYAGDFELAISHLNILKMATSREIANDAMQLSLLIQDNYNMDTTEVPMKRYAAIDLLKFQGKLLEALLAYDELLKDYPHHTLCDEILWEKANIYLKIGNYEEAVAALKTLLEKYPDDILADDANFLLGTIYEEKLKNIPQAMQVYQHQLLKYPSSIYSVEARKRFRKLR